jgi:hypothetical protein
MNYGPRWATNWHRKFFSELLRQAKQAIEAGLPDVRFTPQKRTSLSVA